MGLEIRGNNYYYYRKERRGERVVSVYVGKGELAHLAVQLDKLRKEEEKLETESSYERQVIETSQQEEIEDKIDAVCALASAYVDALFLTSGYHQHSRTWRRKRSG